MNDHGDRETLAALRRAGRWVEPDAALAERIVAAARADAVATRGRRHVIRSAGVAGVVVAAGLATAVAATPSPAGVAHTVSPASHPSRSPVPPGPLQMSAVTASQAIASAERSLAGHQITRIEAKEMTEAEYDAATGAVSRGTASNAPCWVVAVSVNVPPGWGFGAPAPIRGPAPNWVVFAMREQDPGSGPFVVGFAEGHSSDGWPGWFDTLPGTAVPGVPPA